MDIPSLLSVNASAFLELSSYNFIRASLVVSADMSNSLESQLEHLMQEEYPHMAGSSPSPRPAKRLRGANLLGSQTQISHAMLCRSEHISVYFLLCVMMRFRAFSDLEIDPPAPHILAPAPVNPNAITMPAMYEHYMQWGRNSFPDFAPETCKLVSIANYICDMDAANYCMSNKQKLMLAMLIDGHNWRAHCRQAFRYEDGAWVRCENLSIDAWDLLMALEGLFVQVSLDLAAAERESQWSWEAAGAEVLNVIRHLLQQSVDVIKELCGVAKANSDHLRKATGNKAWHAKWSRRVADMLAQYRKTWESEISSKPLTKLFLLEWDTPMPRSTGVCFTDVYLDENWDVAPKARDRNCYLKLNYRYLYEHVIAQNPNIDVNNFRIRLRLFLESLYYKNEHGFQIKLCFLHAAFKRVCTSKMIFQIGKGGDGKGMEAILDRTLFGDLASSTLDCGVFLDRSEFRKSAELAWNMANVRIQEMDHKSSFHADLWKRFVVDEDIDCRVNYGFTTKRKFGESLKVQELNYDNIPTIEEARDRNKCCQQLERRIVCLRMGKGKLVSDVNEVDTDNGVFLLIPQDELSAFLSHEITAALFLREYCIPFFQETSLAESLRMINDLAGVHADLVRDTKWLASRLAGGNAPPPGDETDDVNEFNRLVIAAHSQTPWKRVLKEYLIHKIEALPGAIYSSKGKRTKLSYLIEAVDNADVILLKQVDHGCFHKLLLDWTKLQVAMDNHGGIDKYGSWTEWGDPFDLLHTQEKWTGAAFHHDAQIIRQNKTIVEDLSALGRNSELRLQEKVNLTALIAYAQAGNDRRPDLLEAYIARHRRDGLVNGDFSSIDIAYYRRPHYGRLLSRGPSGQKLTREARFIAFGSHCAEVDAPSCHPRLLVSKLRESALWDEDKFPMLNKVVQFYKQWRESLAQYSECTVGEAKVELIRIFYGGRPSVEIPYLLKLCDEVQRAAMLLLKMPTARVFADLYEDRPNPEFSRLSALLSFEEAKLMHIMSEHMGDSVQMLLFDGCYVECDSLAAELDVVEACRACEASVIPMAIKSWPSGTELSSIARLLIRKDLGLWSICRASLQGPTSSCLHYVIAVLQPDCDTDLLEVTEDEGDISAREFNEHMRYSSQRAPQDAYRMIYMEEVDLSEVNTLNGNLIVHQAAPGGGHWSGIRFLGDSTVCVVDSESSGRHLHTTFQILSQIVSSMENLSWFRLQTLTHDVALDHHAAYDLRGSGPCKRPASQASITMKVDVHCPDRLVLSSPLQTCLECGASIRKERVIEARLYALDGVHHVEHLTKKCSNRNCATLHHYNYRWVDGNKINSSHASDLEFVFVNPKTVFTRSFLDYHGMLQFRGHISVHAINFAQKEVMWKDENEHARWRLEYSTAQLYLNVLQVGELMWCDLSDQDTDKKLLSICLEKPLADNFVQEYHKWFQSNEITVKESKSMYELVIDGHEKVSSRCSTITPAHGGRPRKDGTVKKRTNGWFMAIHPESGLIVGVQEMIHPENNDLAVRMLEDAAEILPVLDCIIYDRMCCALQAVRRSDMLRDIKYFCVDKFHAHGHGTTCPCSPLVHKKLDKRLREVNTSVAEQTFAWFRNYARTFNTMSPQTHFFYVLFCVQKHNELIRKNSVSHLSPFSSGRKRRRSQPYSCSKSFASKVFRRPTAKVCLRRPAACMAKRPASSK
ncbi:unnamed protein product [Symbiodinium sp. CCMP2592]|nr:unnamed protein product [Symbiodinium sp. CCMP2592]